MEPNSKSKIYKNIISYLLETTNYGLHSIASIANTSFEDIRAIYYENSIPSQLFSEKQLVQLYLIALDFNTQKRIKNKKSKDVQNENTEH